MEREEKKGREEGRKRNGWRDAEKGKGTECMRGRVTGHGMGLGGKGKEEGRREAVAPKLQFLAPPLQKSSTVERSQCDIVHRLDVT